MSAGGATALCPQCGARLERVADDADALVSCPACGAETERARLAVVPAPAVREPKSHERPPVPLPSDVELSEEPGVLKLRWRLAPQRVGMVMLGWAALLGVLLIVQVSAHPGLPIFLGLIGPSLFGYAGLALLLDRTEVEVRKGSLRIKVGPLPTFGGGQYTASQLSQLYVSEKVSTYKGRTTVTHALRARLKTGKHVTLISRLASSALALYLEQTIEKRFEITDTPVVNELERQ